jgi:WD40 repeat protein
MRSASGGHQEPITNVKFDYHLSLIATANEVGEIAVWDFETS